MSTPRNPPLSAEAIVAAALQIADADGLEAVTMRAVGTRLGAAAMALYRHIPSKDALLEHFSRTLRHLIRSYEPA